jgi:hypothetical protein
MPRDIRLTAVPELLLQDGTQLSPTQSGGPATPPPTAGKERAARRSRPLHNLPTDRMKFEKQVDALGVFAKLTGTRAGVVTAEDLGRALELHVNTAGLTSGFFIDSGWLDKRGRGSYAATQALLDYYHHLIVQPEDLEGAKASLAQAARESWYWTTVEPLLVGGVARHMVLAQLAKTADAYTHKPQLELLFDWMDWLRLTRQDGDTLYARDSAPLAGSALHSHDQEVAIMSEPVTPVPITSVTTMSPAIDSEPSTMDVVQVAPDPVASLVSFNLSVNITADDAAKLSPEQLSTLLEVVQKLRG